VVHREGANFEAALDWALANGGDRVESAAEIITCLGTTWHQLGTRAFAYTERTSQALPTHSPFRGWLTYWEYRRRWDLETDEQLLLDLLAVAEDELRHAGDPAPLAALLAYGTNLGPDAGLASDWGVRRAQEAVDLAHSLGDDWLLGTACASLVMALVEADRPRDAIGPLGEARDAFTRRGDVDRLDGLSMLEAELVALDGRHEEAWDIGARAAAGLVATPSDGTLWHTCLSLARLASHDRPAAAATLVGAGLGALSRMGSIPGAADYHHLYDDVGAARAALGEDEFDRLLDAARSWDADTAVAWVLDLIGGTAPA
jgi:hypothetical protein